MSPPGLPTASNRISTPADTRAFAELAIGVVVGSAIPRGIEEHPGRDRAAVAVLVTSQREAL